MREILFNGLVGFVLAVFTSSDVTTQSGPVFLYEGSTGSVQYGWWCGDRETQTHYQKMKSVCGPRNYWS